MVICKIKDEGIKMLKWGIAILILVGSVQTVSAGIKVYPEAKTIEGKIVFAYRDMSKTIDAPMSLLILKDGVLEKIPNIDMRGEILFPKYSPSGNVIGFYADKGSTYEEELKNRGIYVINENGNNLQRIVKGPQTVFDFLDTNHLVYWNYSAEKRQDEYLMVDVIEKKIGQLTINEIEENYHPSRWPIWDASETKYSPDGTKKVWYKEVRKDVFSDLWMTDLKTGVEMLLLEERGGSYYSDPVWSSDSKKIMILRRYAFAEYFFSKMEIILYDIETKETVRLLKAPEDSIKGFDWWTLPVK